MYFRKTSTNTTTPTSIREKPPPQVEPCEPLDLVDGHRPSAQPADARSRVVAVAWPPREEARAAEQGHA